MTIQTGEFGPKIKAAHQEIVRTAKAFADARQAFGELVRSVRIEIAVPADNSETRWIMTEDASQFFEVDNDVALDFTKPVQGPR